MRAFVFPGQGAQKKGMGEKLFEKFSHEVEKADNILGYSIRELCLEDTHSQLDQTLYVQPALYTVNALMFFDYAEKGITPDFAAGHSVGEYNALHAAGAFDFETGLKLVLKRAELMNRFTGGRMAAVIGLSEKQVAEVITNNQLDSLCISHCNTPAQVVLSGPKNDIIQAEKFFDTAGAQLYIHLPLDGAFHSKYMQGARDEFSAYIKTFDFSGLTVPVIANSTGKPYRDIDIKKNLSDQFTQTVRWTDSIQYLLKQGDITFYEVGPGSVLTGMIDKIKILNGE